MLLYADIGFLGYQYHFCEIFIGADFLDITVVFTSLEASCNAELRKTACASASATICPQHWAGLRGCITQTGQTHWTAIQSGGGEGYQVKTAVIWRAVLQVRSCGF